VKPTLQLNHPDYDHIFAIGDVAHTTAIKAGHVGYWQAGVAVENIVKLLEGKEESELKVYEPTKPMIKVTVGKVSLACDRLDSADRELQHKAVVQMWEEDGTPKVTVTEDMPEDLQALSMWSYVGAKTDDVHL
jgi:NADH dehydrogenase FAD-containing subunit